MGPITELMIKEHARLHKILEDFEKTVKEKFEKSKDIFREFKWSLEKHFFKEETAIFAFSAPKTKKQKLELSYLIRDHRDMIEICTGIVRDLLEGKKPYTIRLKGMIGEHEKKEVKILYPRMDKELPKEEKEEIIRKAKEIKIL